ncbi:MAG: aldo/keto reductase [Trueperaceae bacterium]|nr:MAG: aldo/keto reductase [Trueperaceae bacterium]
MDYRRLGKTELQVSSLSFGASSLGGVFREVDEVAAIEAVHTALDFGINYIDVAPAYGGTRAETVLGKALEGIPRERYFLSTKVGKYTDPDNYGRDEFDYSRERIRRSLTESMQRLGVDHLDIVHLHDFDYQGQVHADAALGEGFQALEELRAEGRVGAVGAGIYAMDLWKRVLTEADVDVVLIHNHYTLCDIRLWELLPLAARRDIGVINASPFGSGLLTGREPPAWHPASEAERAIFKQAAAFCAEQGVPLPRLALQFSSQHPDVPTTMFSSASPESVRRNLAWAQEPYDPVLVAQVQRILEPVMNRQWRYSARG